MPHTLEIVNAYEPVSPEFWECLEQMRNELLARWLLRLMREDRQGKMEMESEVKK